MDMTYDIRATVTSYIVVVVPTSSFSWSSVSFLCFIKTERTPFEICFKNVCISSGHKEEFEHNHPGSVYYTPWKKVLERSFLNFMQDPV